jgi:hypothetical protein
VTTCQSETYETIISTISKEMQKYTDDKTRITEEQKGYCIVSNDAKEQMLASNAILQE